MSNKRKSNASIIPFIGPIEKNCLANQKEFRKKAQQCGAFGMVPWEQASWNVTEIYANRKRGSKANRQNDFIHFTQHSQSGKKIGEPIEMPLADIVKSLVTLRHFSRGQSVSSHMIFIRAFRYLRDELAKKNFDISNVTTYDFDEAAKAALKREGDTTSYKLVGHLEEIAGLLDANGLSKIRLEWRCRVKKRPKIMSPDRIEDAESAEPDTDRLPPEDAIKAIAKLYTGNVLPKDIEESDLRFGDRILLLVVVLMVCTGFRIGEVLALRALRVRSNPDGSKFLEYFVEKRSAGNVTIEIKQKVLMSETEDLVTEVVDELVEKTQAVRDVAKYIYVHGVVPLVLQDKSVLSKMEIFDALGINDNLTQFLKTRGIPYEVERLSGGTKKDGNKRILVMREELLAGLLMDHWNKPVFPGDKTTRLELHDALCVAFPFQFHAAKCTLRYAAKPIHEGNIRDFLMGRESTKSRKSDGGEVLQSVCQVMSVFEKYDVVDENGEPYGLRSHGFRHFLNHMLDDGGLPDLVQAIWFGRKNLADTNAYQHLTHAQRAAKLYEQILKGNVDGYVPRVLKLIPVERQKTFLEARIRAVFDVGPGMCVHDFAQLPCEKHLECTAECHDYLWIKGDEDRVEELKRQAAIAYISLEAVKREIANPKVYVENEWLRHCLKKVEILKAQLSCNGLGNIDLEELAARYLENA